MVENPMSYSEVFTRSGHNFKEKVTRYEGLVRFLGGFLDGSNRSRV